MTHLEVELSQGSRETVTFNTISKLYDIVHSGTLDNSSHLEGWIYTPIAYRTHVLEITDDMSDITKDLTVDVANYAIEFEDVNMITYLNSIGVGSNGFVLETEAASATVAANSENQTVTKFNEFRFFTNITSSKGGWTGTTSGSFKFKNWTALEEVDISNLTSIGHNGGYPYEDGFYGCTALKTVTASSNLQKIGYNVFYGCTNLENITGLSGTILIYGPAFYNALKLSDTSFQNVVFLPIGGNEWFYNCKALTSITLDTSLISLINFRTFYGCSNLVQINGMTGITTIDSNAFRNCSALTTIDTSNVTTIKAEAFRGCSSLATINTSNVTEIYDGAFRECSSLTSLDLSSLSTSSNNVKAFFEGDEVFYNFLALTTLGITSIPQATTLKQYAFRNCYNLTGELSFQNVTTLATANYGAQFNHCEKLTKISLPKVRGVNGSSQYLNAARAMFGYCYMLKIIDLGDQIETILPWNFLSDSLLKAVLIRTSSVPYTSTSQGRGDYTLTQMFGNSPDVNIYVPDDAVNTYKQTLPYSNFLDRIKSINEYNEAAILA